MPPAPSAATISYGPSRSPAERGIAGDSNPRPSGGLLVWRGFQKRYPRMSVHEPMTFATDLVLGGGAIALALPLLGPTTRGRRARRWWGWALLLTGVAAWTGGFWHGFGP